MNFRKLIYALPPLAVIVVGTGSGAVLLGVVVPIILFLIAVLVFGDMGGPLFWPIFIVLGFFGGAIVGFCFSILWLLLFWIVRYLLPPSDRRPLTGSPAWSSLDHGTPALPKIGSDRRNPK